LKQRRTELPEKFAARGLEDIEITRVINVIASGAFRVSHAMQVLKGGRGHAAL